MEIYFETYGCTANYNSTEIMKGLVQQAGLNITSNFKFADIVIINSCIVKEPTEEKIRRRIQDIIKEFPNKKIILSGCMPRLNKEKFELESNIYLLDTTHIKDIIKLIQDIQTNQYSQEKYIQLRKEIKLNLPKVSKEKLIGITQISEGCLGNCSYCVTRLAKGKLFSYPIEDILKSIQADLQAGCKEIWITSQDCASYGLDQGKPLLPELLKKIIQLKYNFNLRIGMMNPNNIALILDDLIEIYKDKKIYKFLHLPIQSGSDPVLKKMNRNYTKKDVLKIINKFKENFTEIHISTDIIVGYPEETEKYFQETFELVKEIEPETINVSKFWPRQGTPAFKLKDKINTEARQERAKKLILLHRKICTENHLKLKNKETEVFVNQKGLADFPNTYIARDENYKLYAIQTKEKILGKKVKVKIINPTPFYLISEFIV